MCTACATCISFVHVASSHTSTTTELQLNTNYISWQILRKCGPSFTLSQTRILRWPGRINSPPGHLSCFQKIAWGCLNYQRTRRRVSILGGVVWISPYCWGWEFHISNWHPSKQQATAPFSPRDILLQSSSQTTDRDIIATQHAQSAWQGHAFQTLVEFVSNCQFLQAVRQGHAFQTLVEFVSKCQFLQAVRQGHAFQTLVEVMSKS